MTGNSANLGGGGVYISYGSTTLKNVTVSSNHAGAGGGVYRNCPHGTVQLTGCTLSGNTAAAGGGLYDASYGSLSLSNCTVSGNSALNGGAMHIGNMSVTITNCTISNNSADNCDGVLTLYAISLVNTIVAGNGNTNISGSFTDGGGNLTSGNPLLAPLGNYGGPTLTMALLPGSPAIGGGIGTLAPLKDQRGESRSGPVDIGAFQSQGFTLTPEADSSPQSTGIGNAFAKPLAVTVTAINPVEPVDGGVISFTAPVRCLGHALGSLGDDRTGRRRRVGHSADDRRHLHCIRLGGRRLNRGKLRARPTRPAPGVGGGELRLRPVGDGHNGLRCAAGCGGHGPFGNLCPASPSRSPRRPPAHPQPWPARRPSPTPTAGPWSRPPQARSSAPTSVTASAAGVTAGAAFALTNTGGPQNLAAQPVDAVAGQSFINVVMATFTDADPSASPSEFTAGIDWGDGITTSSTTVIADGQGRFDVLGTHTYVNAGNYTFQVQITDSNGAVAKATSSATVTAKEKHRSPQPGADDRPRRGRPV